MDGAIREMETCVRLETHAPYKARLARLIAKRGHVHSAKAICELFVAECDAAGVDPKTLLMDTLRAAKLYLSLCVAIQLLKIIKFMKVLIPKMALATAVLYKGVMDLFFFGVTFLISMLAFSIEDRSIEEMPGACLPRRLYATGATATEASTTHTASFTPSAGGDDDVLLFDDLA